MLKSYSYSSLDAYKACPKKFDFQYIQKLKVKDDKVSAMQYLGTAAHRVLKKLYVLAADKIVMPLEEMLRLYDEEWAKVKPELFIVTNQYYAVDDYIRIGREMLENYYEKFHPFDQDVLLGAEERFSYQLPGASVSFNGIIDRITKRSDGMIEICDYKTGEHMIRPKDDRFFYQMGLYQLAYTQNFPQYDKIELSQYFLRKKEKVSYILSESELDELIEGLHQAVREIKYAERVNSFPTAEGNHCLWCDYVEFCPAKRHKLLLEKEEQSESGVVYTPQKLKELAEEYIETDDRFKEQKSKLDKLKTELLDALQQTEIDKFVGDSGFVKIKHAMEEKFITKTDSKDDFLKMSILCRDNKLDEYFILDGRALYNEGYKKGHLPPELVGELEQYLKRVEQNRFTVKREYKDDISKE